LPLPLPLPQIVAELAAARPSALSPAESAALGDVVGALGGFDVIGTGPRVSRGE